MAILCVFGSAFFIHKAQAATRSSFASKNTVLGLSFGIKEAKRFEEIEIPQNAQNVPLLQAPKNIDPQAKAAPAVLVVNDSALSGANIGADGVADANSPFVRTSDQISLYTVHPGDTPSGIAAMFDINEATLYSANDLKSNEKIQPGQVLVILPVAGAKFTTKVKGDTISRIAKSYGADVAKVSEFNNIPSNQALEIGTTIIIPDAEEGSATGHDGAGNAKKPVAAKKDGKAAKVVVKTKSGTYFSCPVPTAVMSQNIHGHNGVDLAAPLGTPIYAAADGQVMIARSGGWGGGYGTYAVIKHPNGMQTMYAHASSLTVSTGENVVKGQLIGRVGSTGDSSGNHTHYEVRGGANTACSSLKKIY